ncbi:TraR/DksA C4-type zinc finger protein [Oceanospirillum sp. HFRX-1_2]
MSRYADELDNAFAESEFSLNLSIDELKRIQQQPGTEFCVDCGDSIAPPRREKVPYAVRCFDCQSLHEQLNRQ